jgi:hypothetical protein
MEEYKLFNYKGKDIVVRQKGKKYQVGIRGKNEIDIWFESTSYDSINLVVTSGREYARIVIDKMLLAEKEENYVKNNK